MSRSIIIMSMVVCAVVVSATRGAVATSQATVVPWTARDTAGNDVTVPSRERTTIVEFLRPGQAQSEESLKQIKEVVAKEQASPVGIVIVLSGPDNVAAAREVEAGQAQLVLDPQYAISGKMDVHVWPATVVVAADGTALARLSGMRPTFATDLAAHLDFAARRIDQAALEKRLATRQVVAATSQQAATRYLIIANALIERGQFEQALAEIDQGLQREPREVSLRLARGSLLLRLKQFDAALATADELEGAVPSWQNSVLRAEALIALERWAEAKQAVEAAVRLNPHPAHAHYLAGQVYIHDQDFKAAAASFRAAYEASISNGTTRSANAGRR